MRPAAAAMLVIALMSGVASAAEPGRESFERGRRLLETNCRACPDATRQGLEDGVIALRQSLAEGFGEPAHAHLLLAEAYATLAQVYANRDPDAVARFTALRRDTLARLAASTPAEERSRPAETPRQPERPVDTPRAPAPAGETKQTGRPPDERVVTAPPAPERCEAYRGRALRGQSLELPLRGGLLFRLAPDAYGWTIGVITTGRPDEDFAGIATPPYHGVNARYLEGWHFRNLANTGPNAGDVNAPQHQRDFAFVLSASDYERASRALEALLWGAPPETERQQLMETLERVSRGRGRLRVTGSSLGNLQPGVQAWFEWLAFDVELCRPASG